ncbi:MAG: hypothetical protein ABW198_04990 [Pseudorhodoplanes sp.]
MSTQDFTPGGYRFIPAVFQYSGGVAALPGYEICRVRFHTPMPLVAGFEFIAKWIAAQGRPLTAFCACELRSPGQWNDAGFKAFNERYVVTLKEWGIFDGVTNPVARSNTIPEISGPAEPCFYAFSYTVPQKTQRPTFVISGGGDARAGSAPYSERIVRLGDTSAGGMREKACFVLDEMERRLSEFGFTWADTTATQVYCVHDIHPFFGDEIARRGAMPGGLTWFFNRPPVQGLDYEMDCRGIAVEQVT